jgi:hypothetical protein
MAKIYTHARQIRMDLPQQKRNENIPCTHVTKKPHRRQRFVDAAATTSQA